MDSSGLSGRTPSPPGDVCSFEVSPASDSLSCSSIIMPCSRSPSVSLLLPLTLVAAGRPLALGLADARETLSSPPRPVGLVTGQCSQTIKDGILEKKTEIIRIHQNSAEHGFQHELAFFFFFFLQDFTGR